MWKLNLLCRRECCVDGLAGSPVLGAVGQDGGEAHGEGDLAEVLGLLARLHQGDDQVLLLVDVGRVENNLSLAHEVVPQAPVVVVHLIDKVVTPLQDYLS